MKHIILFYFYLFAVCMCTQAKDTADKAAGIIRKIDSQQMTVNIQFYSPCIVRIIKYPMNSETPEKESFSVIMQPESQMAKHLRVSDESDRVLMTTDILRVILNTKSGQIDFYTHNGDTLLQELNTVFTMRKGDADEGKYRVSQTWMLHPDDDIFGLGQLRDETMSWRGRRMKLWNYNTYIAIPYFTTQRGYGLYWDNAGQSFFEDSKKGTTLTSEVGLCTDYYFMYKDGTQDGIVNCIRQLTGQATMFPLWAMGHWQCRERYKTSDELAEVLDKYRELQIPLDAIVQDWQYWGCDSNWNAMRFMNPYYINKVGDQDWEKYLPRDMKKLTPQEPRLKSPEEMVDYVHDKDAHLMITIWANFGLWTEPYAELKKIGGLIDIESWPFNNGVQPYDPFNPKACDLYWKYLSHLYKMDFDAWWTDSSEPDHREKPGDDDKMTYAGTWRSVKNAFPLMHNKGIYEHQRAMKGNKKRSVQMTRSGAFGLQHYGTFSWSGDIRATWEEMKQQIPSGLNYSLCGIPFWNTDLGGFFYRSFAQKPNNPGIWELQTRWMQWGTFMPLMRNHCSSPMVSEIYKFGKKGDWVYDVIVDYVKLRYRLLPYIYSTAGDCVQGSGTMMRALVMDFPKDKKAIRRNDEYMFGRSLLVKPVTDPLYTWTDDKKWGHEIYPDTRKAAAPVRVYLPTNTLWYDFWTNETVEGGKEVQKLCPIDIMPVYVKAGTIMPFGPEVQYSDEKPWDDLEIRIYPGADGTFTLYEDEGDNYNYEKGAFTQIVFSWKDATRELTIDDRKGNYKGMLQQRKFRVILVNQDSGRGDQPMKGGKNIDYNGKQINIKL